MGKRAKRIGTKRLLNLLFGLSLPSVGCAASQAGRQAARRQPAEGGNGRRAQPAGRPRLQPLLSRLVSAPELAHQATRPAGWAAWLHIRLPARSAVKLARRADVRSEPQELQLERVCCSHSHAAQARAAASQPARSLGRPAAGTTQNNRARLAACDGCRRDLPPASGVGVARAPLLCARPREPMGIFEFIGGRSLDERIRCRAAAAAAAAVALCVGELRARLPKQVCAAKLRPERAN